MCIPPKGRPRARFCPAWTKLAMRSSAASRDLVIQLRILAARRGIRQKLEGSSPGLGRGQNAEMSRARDHVKFSLADPVHLVGPLESRALGEVVRVAVSVLGGHWGKDAVLQREVNEARVRVADHQDTRGPVRLDAALDLSQKRRVGRAVLLTESAVRSEPSGRGELVVVQRRR